MLFGEVEDLLPLLHRAVVIDQFADDADRWQAGEVAQVHCRFGMAGAHQHAAFLGHQRKDGDIFEQGFILVLDGNLGLTDDLALVEGGFDAMDLIG